MATILGFEAFGDTRIYLDAETHLPVMDQSFGIGVGDQRRGYDRHYAWELLPATPQNLNLLDVSAQHSDAATVPLTGSAFTSIDGQLGGLIRPPITPAAEGDLAVAGAARAGWAPETRSAPS